jgi:tRNA (guanine37-N1)-methyltransferase
MLTDSFQDGLFDCPHYTKPALYRDMRVPDVLLSGDHKAIANWRKEQRVSRTNDRK